MAGTPNTEFWEGWFPATSCANRDPGEGPSARRGENQAGADPGAGWRRPVGGTAPAPHHWHGLRQRPGPGGAVREPRPGPPGLAAAELAAGAGLERADRRGSGRAHGGSGPAGAGVGSESASAGDGLPRTGSPPPAHGRGPTLRLRCRADPQPGWGLCAAGPAPLSPRPVPGGSLEHGRGLRHHPRAAAHTGMVVERAGPPGRSRRTCRSGAAAAANPFATCDRP